MPLKPLGESVRSQPPQVILSTGVCPRERGSPPPRSRRRKKSLNSRGDDPAALRPVAECGGRRAHRGDHRRVWNDLFFGPK